MKFRIIPSTADGRVQLLTTYLINDTLAIDAGAIAIGLSREEQLRIRSIIITHTHLDHIFSLPLYLTDLFEEIREPVRLYATQSDFDALRQYIFNTAGVDTTGPDEERRSRLDLFSSDQIGR